MRHRHILTIRRDDHTGEPIAKLFLVSDMNPRSRLDLVGAYLGPKLEILNLALFPDRVEVEVEYTAHPKEASHLAEAAAAISLKGAPRIALNLLKESLEMDPVNPTATLAYAAAQVELGRDREALITMRRAREATGDSPELLRNLAAVSVRLGLKLAAVEYLKLAFELAPNDRSIVKMLHALNGTSVISPGAPTDELEAPAFLLDSAFAIQDPSSDSPSQGGLASLSSSKVDSKRTSRTRLTPGSKPRHRPRLVPSRHPK
jgi:tetratricopeptide (TPR) repeat protein